MSNITCGCIALYDFYSEETDMKRFFYLMENLSAHINLPWQSIGGTSNSGKLIQFKNGKKKLEKMGFQAIKNLSLMGGVREPGTNEDWRTCAFFNASYLRGHLVLCFEESLWRDAHLTLVSLLQDLLSCAPFSYGIVYERDRDLGPDCYSVGVLCETDRKRVPQEERKQISAWAKKYSYGSDKYRTGLLRDVYPHNILTSPHLSEKVGNVTLGDWIKADSCRGTLTPLTDTHTLWSVDPASIPLVQEVLQEAGLLLCYKP